MHKDGDKLSVTLNDNVHATNTQDNSTLTSGQLTANGTTQEITEVQGKYNVKMSPRLTLNGRMYQLDIKAQHFSTHRKNSTNVTRFTGDVGMPRPVLTLVPLEAGNAESLKLTADALEYVQYSQDEIDARLNDQQHSPITFMQAQGSAVMTAVTVADNTGAKQHIYATAPVILGNFERAGDVMAQVFHFDENGTKTQPHLEMTGQGATAAADDMMKLDADTVAYYPDAEKQLTSQPRVLEMQANGDVKFFSLRHTVSKEHATETKGKGKKASLFNFDLPTNQLWTVAGGELTSWMMRKQEATDVKSAHTFARAVWVTHQLGEDVPHTLLFDRDAPTNSPPVIDMLNDTYINLDSGEFAESPESVSGGGN
jgi:hypothetical protein